ADLTGAIHASDLRGQRPTGPNGGRIPGPGLASPDQGARLQHADLDAGHREPQAAGGPEQRARRRYLGNRGAGHRLISGLAGQAARGPGGGAEPKITATWPVPAHLPSSPRVVAQPMAIAWSGKTPASPSTAANSSRYWGRMEVASPHCFACSSACCRRQRAAFSSWDAIHVAGIRRSATSPSAAISILTCPFVGVTSCTSALTAANGA